MVNVYYGLDCNLTCKGCLSGSDIIRSKQYDPTVDEIMQSITDLSKHVNNVTTEFTLLGGDPLLYWETVAPVARYIRALFPDAIVNITTNGVLLHKFKDRVIDLLLELDNSKLSITNHFSEFVTDSSGVKYLEHLDQFLTDPRLNKIHRLHYDIPNRNINISIHEFVDGFQQQWIQQGNKLKPFATNDPAGSMQHGCIGNICSVVYKSKLYKCPRLAVLPAVLSKTNQLDDSDWQKYLNYIPVDLTKDNIREELKKFESNQGQPINECDMCHNNRIIEIARIPRTKENIFTKPYV